jgi:hypothetical protein
MNTNTDDWDTAYFEERASETSSEYDPYVDYGDDKLARAVQETDRVRELLSEGVTISAYSIIAAVEFLNLETLRALSDAGGDVNKRPEAAHDPLDDVAQSWAGSNSLLKFEEDPKEWYPIIHAAYLRVNESERHLQAAMMTTLLDAGADIFATYRQPLAKRRSRVSLYPGEKVRSQAQGNEESLPVQSESSYRVRCRSCDF